MLNKFLSFKIATYYTTWFKEKQHLFSHGSQFNKVTEHIM